MLYEWNYRKQLLRIQVERGAERRRRRELGRRSKRTSSPRSSCSTAPAPRGDPRPRPGRAARRRDRPRRDRDRGAAPRGALRLPGLDPRARHVGATQIPLVFLTSNGTRELSEALKRRCLYLYLDYPTLERERAIVLAQVPGIAGAARRGGRARRPARCVPSTCKKHPSISETLDWARTLVLLGIEQRRRRDRQRHAAHPAQVPVGHRGCGQRARCRVRLLTAGTAQPRSPPCSTSSPAS